MFQIVVDWFLGHNQKYWNGNMKYSFPLPSEKSTCERWLGRTPVQVNRECRVFSEVI